MKRQVGGSEGDTDLCGVWDDVLGQFCQEESDDVGSQSNLPRGGGEGGVGRNHHLGALGDGHEGQGNAAELESNEHQLGRRSGEEEKVSYYTMSSLSLPACLPSSFLPLTHSLTLFLPPSLPACLLLLPPPSLTHLHSSSLPPVSPPPSSPSLTHLHSSSLPPVSPPPSSPSLTHLHSPSLPSYLHIAACLSLFLPSSPSLTHSLTPSLPPSPLVCEQEEQFGHTGRLGQDGSAHVALGQVQEEGEGVLESL